MEVVDYLLGKKAGSGTDTSDADATASDIAISKTAYVKGNKVTGNVPIGSSSMATNYASSDVSIYLDDLKVDTEQRNTNQMFRPGDKISVYAPLSDIAPVVGATANKIKKDEVICGVTGTYEGGGKYTPKYLYQYCQLFRGYTGNDLSDEINGIDVSNILDYNSFFLACSGVTNLDLSSWTMGANYPSQDKSLAGMFQSCTNLTNVTLGTASNVIYIQATFMDCGNLKTIDMANISGTLQGAIQAFEGCTSLEKIDIRNLTFNYSTSSNYMLNNVPTNCEIIVKDTTVKSWFNSKFPTYTNVKTAAEYGA